MKQWTVKHLVAVAAATAVKVAMEEEVVVEQVQEKVRRAVMTLTLILKE